MSNAGKVVLLRRRTQRGVALITVLLVLLIASALAVALMYVVNSEQKLQSNDAQGGIAYYGAEAGMEKMMADLAALYSAGNSSPTAAQIAAIACPNGTASCSNQPDPSTLNNTSFSEYAIDVPLAADGTTPAYQERTITSGTNAGLVAQILPLTLAVTANQPGGQQVRMTRDVEVALIPVFQFGVFSDGDLDYFPGTNFNFGGRAQTNQNLFLAAGPGNNLVFTGPIRAYFDVIRDTLENGVAVSASGHTGSVYVPTTPSGCDAFVQSGTPSGTCQALTLSPDQGSVTGGTMAPSTEPSYSSSVQPNSQWTTIQRAYGSQLENGGASGSGPGTGASPLTLSFVCQPSLGCSGTPVSAIELIRRPQPTDNQTLSNARLYNKAQIRILLSDSASELPGGSTDQQNVHLVNDPSNSQDRCSRNANYLPCLAEGDPGVDGDWTGVGADPKHNLIGGWLRVEYRDGGGAYHAVTQEWLQLGVTRSQPITDSEHNVPPNPNGNFDPLGQHSILILQQPHCTVSGNICQPVTPAGDPPLFQERRQLTTDFMPINIYDVREGNYRDVDDGNCRVGGVMNLVEINVGNLQQWLTGATPGHGTQVENSSQNGYIIYFSDRRGMVADPDAGNVKIGEYGFTDVINEANSDGAPNAVADQGELLDSANKVETWGAGNLGQGFTIATGPGCPSSNGPFACLVPTGNPNSTTTPDAACMVGAKNYVSGARHALRLINASDLTSLPKPGFTVASENPVYVMGNYNANDANGFGGQHASAAVIADSVTFLSRIWSDFNSFMQPTNVQPNKVPNRTSATDYYRLAIVSGKNQPFALAKVANLSCANSAGRASSGPCPTDGQSPALPYHDFGTDGGVQNFVRLLENWSGQNLNYMGSFGSLYFSYYATGVYKCCTSVFSPPTRNYSFDTDFQTLAKEPPGTPQFEDVVNIGFRQDFSNIGH